MQRIKRLLKCGSTRLPLETFEEPINIRTLVFGNPGCGKEELFQGPFWTGVDGERVHYEFVNGGDLQSGQEPGALCGNDVRAVLLVIDVSNYASRPSEEERQPTLQADLRSISAFASSMCQEKPLLVFTKALYFNHEWVALPERFLTEEYPWGAFEWQPITQYYVKEFCAAAFNTEEVYCRVEDLSLDLSMTHTLVQAALEDFGLKAKSTKE